jgi:hypothetical protein
MSKGKSEIESLKGPFNEFLKENLSEISVDLVETIRKKKNSEELSETEFVAIRFPIKRSELADLLDCETKNVSSLMQGGSNQLSRSPKMRARVVELAELQGRDKELVMTHKDVRFDCEADHRGRGPSDWIQF